MGKYVCGGQLLTVQYAGQLCCVGRSRHPHISSANIMSPIDVARHQLQQNAHHSAQLLHAQKSAKQNQSETTAELRARIAVEHAKIQAIAHSMSDEEEQSAPERQQHFQSVADDMLASSSESDEQNTGEQRADAERLDHIQSVVNDMLASSSEADSDELSDSGLVAAEGQPAAHNYQATAVAAAVEEEAAATAAVEEEAAATAAVGAVVRKAARNTEEGRLRKVAESCCCGSSVHA